MSADNVVEFNPEPFQVEIRMGVDSFDASHPATLTSQQAEKLLVVVMRIIQRTGHDPWHILDVAQASPDTQPGASP